MGVGGALAVDPHVPSPPLRQDSRRGRASKSQATAVISCAPRPGAHMRKKSATGETRLVVTHATFTPPTAACMQRAAPPGCVGAGWLWRGGQRRASRDEDLWFLFSVFSCARKLGRNGEIACDAAAQSVFQRAATPNMDWCDCGSGSGKCECECEVKKCRIRTEHASVKQEGVSRVLLSLLALFPAGQVHPILSFARLDIYSARLQPKPRLHGCSRSTSPSSLPQIELGSLLTLPCVARGRARVSPINSFIHPHRAHAAVIGAAISSLGCHGSNNHHRSQKRKYIPLIAL